MFARSNSKVALTFLCLVVALGLATVSEANSLVQSPRDHAQLNRMIKKRAVEQRGLFDLPPFTPVNGAAGDPTGTPSTDTGAATGTTTGTSTSTGTSTATGSTTTDSASTTTDPNATGTTTGDSTTTSSTTTDTTTSSSTTTSPTTTSTTSTSTTPPPTTTTPAPETTPPPDTDTQAETSQHTSTKFVTATQSTDSADSTSANSLGSLKDDNNKITKTTLTVIVAVAASIGAIALAWTLFRKWKLRPSSNFDDRMQPIDWQPTGPEDSGVPTHRRAGSAASHGSFHSGDGHASGYGSNHGHGGLDSLPEHDFTAGASTLAPVGGYADLQRGPSPQPTMSELSRGPSMMHQQPYAPAYDYNTSVRY
ncbi:hypothetical protein C8Q80DRAFT_1215628 [Daedaleopsis nitida]|nr:hypothetical protein C8Q80DRAFT_1215628 [Daedaleopsis nitida]